MRSSFLLPLLFVGASAASAQSADTKATASPRASSPADPVTRLEALVVTGALENKTAFDLAQGASVLSGHALERRKTSSLGETLDGLPGVASSAYGPGAGRPIIRGFSGERVSVLSDGVGVMDLSTISPDHAVSVEPALAERIEVLRGPAGLLYGNSALGGVVNVLEGRIPLEARPTFGLAEARWDSNSNGRTGLFSVGTEKGGSSVKVQGLRTLTDDQRVPVAGARTLEGSSIDSQSGSVGFGLHGENSDWGAAVSQLESYYGVPIVEEKIAIDLRQRRLDLAGQVRLQTPLFSALRLRGGLSDYRHFERDREGEQEIHTAFRQKGWQGRVELLQAPQDGWTGTSGIQFSDTDASSDGEESVLPPLGQRRWALFSVQEWARPGLTLQLGARAESQRLSLGQVPTEFPTVPGYSAVSGEQRKGVAPSASAGAVWYPDKDTAVALNLTAAERMPLGQELFSNGPHHGTETYEVGRSDLERERSWGSEISVRRKTGQVTGSVGVFWQQFGNYIYEDRVDDTLIPEERNEEGLPVYQFNGAKAEFFGGEAELAVHLIEGERESLHWEITTDYVRATNTSLNRPLPRITPWRVSSQITYERGPWYAAVLARQVFRQGRVDQDEEATAGYLLLGAEAGWQTSFGRHSLEIYARGQNLGDRLARVHTSFLKDLAPLAGRGVVLGVRYLY